MEPIKFEECNVEFAKDQEEYNTLPAFRSEDGIVVFCNKLNLRERIRVLFKGEIWCSLMTFNKPLTPSFHTTKKSDVLTNN